MDMSLGILLVIVGIILLIAETHTPGFFIAIPGTVLVIIGIAYIFMPTIDPILLAVVTLVGTMITLFAVMMFYKKLGEPEPPSTTTIDTLVGKTGVVIKKIEPNTLTGKVRIDSDVWSATADHEIKEGTKVVVIRGEGVHVVVREAE